MPRDVYVFDPTWRDRQFSKELAKASEGARSEVDKRLDDLISALKTTPHPASDPKIQQAFRANSYAGVIQLPGSNLIEYRFQEFGNKLRVIAKWPGCEGDDCVLLLTITISHDHDRMKSLLRLYKSEIKDWTSFSDGSNRLRLGGALGLLVGGFGD